MRVKVKEVEPHVYKVRLWSYLKLVIATILRLTEANIKNPLVYLGEGDTLIYGKKRFVFQEEEDACGCKGCDLGNHRYKALCHHVSCEILYVFKRVK